MIKTNQQWIIFKAVDSRRNKNMEKGKGECRNMPKSSLRHKQKEWSWESGYLYLPYTDPFCSFFVSPPNSTNSFLPQPPISYFCTYLNPVSFSFPALSRIRSPNSTPFVYVLSYFSAYFCTQKGYVKLNIYKRKTWFKKICSET
jgi:hypothetical protein